MQCLSGRYCFEGPNKWKSAGQGFRVNAPLPPTDWVELACAFSRVRSAFVMQHHALCQKFLMFVTDYHRHLHHCFAVAFNIDCGSMVQGVSQRKVLVIPKETFCHDLPCRQCDEILGLQGIQDVSILSHLFFSSRVSWYTHISSCVIIIFRQLSS
jgi:hypothetical protein